MPVITRNRLNDEEMEKLRKHFRPIQEGKHTYVRTSPGNFIAPAPIGQADESIHFDFKVENNNVFVMAWPKSGTTWTEELVWCILNDCDTETAKAVHLRKRNSFLNGPIICGREYYSAVETSSPHPIITTHLPFCFFPSNLIDQCKIVVCLRNPKDTIVSYYHFEKLHKSNGFTGDFKTYFDLFMDNLVLYSPYWDYVVSVWERRKHANICIIFYEDLKTNMNLQIQNLAKFLKKEVSTDQVKKLAEHLSFKQMQGNKAVNYDDMGNMGLYNEDVNQYRFMRKGEIGDWKNFFTEEMNKRLDEAIAKHFYPIGLRFVYE
eukprot:Seg4019.1 transcript_id=Seg4019.1/GoldUCD/mRNA.D3Y31 product="Sulfotransferase 1C4" protein_id=Seg4019.1/GoldUCD/D3Y31